VKPKENTIAKIDLIFCQIKIELLTRTFKFT